MGEINWIKLSTSIFDNRKIKQIRSLPEGDSLVVIWLQLLCLAGTINDSGQIYLTEEIPFTDQMMATAFDEPILTVQLALKTFQSFGMIDILDDIILIKNWEKYQAIEGMEKIREQTRQRVANYREKQKQIECNATSNVTVTQGNALDKNKKENKKENKNISKHIYGEYRHVRLTDEEYSKLQKEFGNADELIKYLDEAIEMKGYKYESHYLAIRKWVVDAVKKDHQQPKQKRLPDFPMNRPEPQISEEEREKQRQEASDWYEQMMKEIGYGN